MVKKNFLGFISILSLSGILMGPTSTLAMEKEEIDNGCFPSRPNFPDELSVYSFSFLSANELGKLAIVSKKWKEVSEDGSLWKLFGAKSKKEYALYFTIPPLYTLINKEPNDISAKITFAFGKGPFSLEKQQNPQGILSMPGPLPFYYQGDFDKYSEIFVLKKGKTFIRAINMPDNVQKELHGIVDIHFLTQSDKKTILGDEKNNTLTGHYIVPVGQKLTFDLKGFLPLLIW